jgi:serine/threonine protein kinase
MESIASLKGFYNKETNILANLSFSGNVVTIKDLGIIRNLDNEYAFIVLDLYENGTIDNIPTDGKYSLMSGQEIIYYFKKILAALSSIHYNGKRTMIHKDIKPQNILVDYERELFISDFGISLIASNHDSNKVILNDGLGTPKYMAPELAIPIVDMAIDGPGYFVDIYALGIMLYKYTTGI